MSCDGGAAHEIRMATSSLSTFPFSPPLKWRAILLDVHKPACFGITLYKLLRSRVERLGTGTDRSNPMIITVWWIYSHIGSFFMPTTSSSISLLYRITSTSLTAFACHKGRNSCFKNQIWLFLSCFSQLQDLGRQKSFYENMSALEVFPYFSNTPKSPPKKAGP